MNRLIRHVNNTTEIADWFQRKADPDHATIILSGVCWRWSGSKWNIVSVDKSWNKAIRLLNRRATKEFKNDATSFS